jgi:hypothetical protein
LTRDISRADLHGCLTALDLGRDIEGVAARLMH